MNKSSHEHSEKPVWRQILRLGKTAPLYTRTIAVLLLMELLLYIGVPLLVPETWFLSNYLSTDAITSTYNFLSGKGILIPDKYTGWKNNPGMAKGNWKIDIHGARSVHPFSIEKGDKQRALFIGSSLINGGTGIHNDESIPAFFENENTEALNFGTMLYSLDQSLLAYRYRLYKYDADIVVVGLDSDPIGGLENVYIPFRYRDQKYMPFLKPRFELKSGTLHRIDVPIEALLSDIPDSPALLNFLAKHDLYYKKFKHYCNFSILPISSALRFAYDKWVTLMGFYREDELGNELLEKLIDEFSQTADRHGAKAYFIAIPSRSDCEHKGIYKILPDIYKKNIGKLNNRGYKIIDLRPALLNCGFPLNQLYNADGAHFTAAANKVIANYIHDIIGTSLNGQ